MPRVLPHLWGPAKGTAMQPIHRQLQGTAHIVAVLSRKGGAFKTYFTTNIAAYLALLGFAVLIVEADDNIKLYANLLASEAELYGEVEDVVPVSQTAYTLFQTQSAIQHAAFHIDLEECFRRTSINRDALAGIRTRYGWQQPGTLDIIPGTHQIRLIDQQIGQESARIADMGALDFNLRLHRALGPFARQYDFILIDTPPSLTHVLANVLIAARYALYPVELFPTSVMDYREARTALYEAQNVQEQLHLPLITPLGFVTSRYEGTEGQQDVLRRFTTQHEHPVTKRLTDALVDIPFLGAVPLATATTDAAQRRRIPEVMQAPAGDAGKALIQIGDQLLQRIGVRAS